MGIVAENQDVKVIMLDTGGGVVSNCYLIVCKKTGDSALIDAPGDATRILKQIEGTNLRYILITHTHFDHLGALSQLRIRLNVPIAVHPLEKDSLPVKAEILINDNDVIKFGEIELRVMHTPGHTPGCVCFLTGNILISGDTLFPGGPGRTGSPAALKQILKSIKEKILVLPDDTHVIPGHGDPTILGKEKEEIAAFLSRKHDDNLCGDVLWLSS